MTKVTKNDTITTMTGDYDDDVSYTNDEDDDDGAYTFLWTTEEERKEGSEVVNDARRGVNRNEPIRDVNV